MSRSALVAGAAAAAVIACAVVAWALVAVRAGSDELCPTYGCSPAAVLDLSELADGIIHDARVHICVEDGGCGDGSVPLHLEPLTPELLRSVSVTLPMRGSRPESIRLTELRVIDGQGNVVLDTRVDVVAPTVDARPVPDNCHPECWRAGFSLRDGTVVATRR